MYWSNGPHEMVFGPSSQDSTEALDLVVAVATIDATAKVDGRQQVHQLCTNLSATVHALLSKHSVNGRKVYSIANRFSSYCSQPGAELALAESPHLTLGRY
jgi:hypothetical protein